MVSIYIYIIYLYIYETYYGFSKATDITCGFFPPCSNANINWGLQWCAVIKTMVIPMQGG